LLTWITEPLLGVHYQIPKSKSKCPKPQALKLEVGIWNLDFGTISGGHAINPMLENTEEKSNRQG
jgi:hypothetical protein